MIRALALAFLLAIPAHAEGFRAAVYNASMSRKGPGLLLQDIEEGRDRQIAAVLAVVAAVRPDILLLCEFDWDPDGLAATAFQTSLAAYPHRVHLRPNTGWRSGHDLDGNGRLDGPQDAFGFGDFPGQYGMLLLSRYPLGEVRSFGTLRWSETGFAMPMTADGTPFPDEQAAAAMRLSSKGHWDVQVQTPLGPVHVLASHPTPPVFDGPEDANGLRNAAEIGFWSEYLSGRAFRDDAGVTATAPDGPVILLGDLNADPVDGDGRHEAIAALLSHPRLQDPLPRSEGGAAAPQTLANAGHRGDPARDTADFPDDPPWPGNLRVDYAQPSRDFSVTGAGVFWPAPGEPLHEEAALASDHRLVWVDVTLP